MEQINYKAQGFVDKVKNGDICDTVNQADY